MAFEYLAEHATFKSVEDMDNNVNQHIDKYRLDLTASERAIVFAIAGRSLMYPGASHLKAETIATVVEVSTKTVYRAIKKLVDLGIIEKVPGTKLNGIKGASIYRLLPYVPSRVSERETEVEASNDMTCPPQSEDLSIKSFNLLSSKQAKNNLYDLENELREQEVNKKVYMNEWQVALFNFLHSLPMNDNLKDELHKVVLATEMNDIHDFVNAKNVFANVLIDIANGTLTITNTLRAVFKGAYKKACERSKSKTINTSSVEEEPSVRKPVPFYDWLNERDSRTQDNSSKHYSNLENWLLW